MKKSVFFGALAGAALAGGVAGAATLDDVKARGTLNCGVSTGVPGFEAPDANGVWQGFDVDVCRAVAAAVLGDPMAVEFVPTTGKTRFTALASGEIDMLSRVTTWTLSRDVDLKFEFVGINYYDGQGFMVPKALGVTSAKELDGATVCVQTGTTTELNLADFFRINNISYEPVLGPLVRHGDNEWGDVVRWSFNAMVAAEELGVTSANVAELASAPVDNPEINRLLGTESNMGEMLGLDADWAVRIIASVGHYGESFERHIGENTPIGLARGLNALWTQGGLQYSPPFR